LVFISLMVVVADELIELVNVGFGTFDVEVLGSEVLGEGGLKEGWWDSFNQGFVSDVVQESFWEVLLQDISLDILILEQF